MFETGARDLWLFTITVFMLNATPGVDMMLATARTLQGGARAGIAASLGISAGCIVHTLAAAFGLAALLATSVYAFTLIKWAGAAYLAWLALAMLRAAARPRAGQAAPADAQPASFAQVFLQGMATNVLNPKIAIFFLALLPQFIAADADNKPLAFLFLGGWMVVQGTVFLLALVALVSLARSATQCPALARGLNGAGGVLFLGLAARLALAERP